MGPTGTGKSGFALEIAKARPAVIINADAMQMVRDLRIITARPTEEEEQQAEHALYGMLDATEPTSVARWIEMVRSVIMQAWRAQKLPLLVGGTGMYVKALAEGLSKVPPVPAEIREQVRSLSTEEAYAKLQQKDAAMAARLKPGDTQRVMRALEVMEATGISLARWQEQSGAPSFPQAQFRYFHMELPRAEIYRRIDQRFEVMMAQGALEEVRTLMQRDLPPGLPILRAHGVPELTAYMREEMSLEEAVAKAQQHTRNYAKRQLTWLRQQVKNSVEIQVNNDSSRQAAKTAIFTLS